MGVRRLQLAKRTYLAGVFAAAIVTVVSGCASSGSRPPPPDESLNSVEINGDRLSLPRPQIVTCTTPGQGQRLFWWQGSDTLVPRRPSEEKYWSSVSLRFAPDPPVPQVLDLQIFWHGRQLNLHWSSAHDSQGESPTLDSSGPHRYTLLGILPGAAAPSPQYYVRIEFNC
jgi:hypothetical protein